LPPPPPGTSTSASLSPTPSNSASSTSLTAPAIPPSPPINSSPTAAPAPASSKSSSKPTCATPSPPALPSSNGPPSNAAATTMTSSAHLEHDQIQKQFGQLNPEYQLGRCTDIENFINDYFRKLFKTKSKYRLGFDVAASGNGDLAAIYVDEVKNDDLW